MSDIGLVVKIPEEAYKLLKNEGVDWLDAEHILNAVANGTPLPKGHGRLIDADKLEYVKNDKPDEIGYHFVPKYIIDNADTIIEADKE